VGSSLLALLLAASVSGAALPRTEIVARLDPAIHRIEATAYLDLRDERSTTPIVRLASKLDVREVSCEGRRIAFEVAPSDSDPALSHVTLHPTVRPLGAR
jgi:hypothetical protein